MNQLALRVALASGQVKALRFNPGPLFLVLSARCGVVVVACGAVERLA